ncbi:MAG: hypothetical protein ABGW87_13695 [Sphingomonadaceae bacterium]
MKSTSRLKISLNSLAIVMLLSGASDPLLAKDVTKDKYVEALRLCTSEMDSATKLACYEKAASALIAATDDGTIAIVDQEKVRDTKRKLFGFSIPDFGIFSGRDDEGKEKKEAEQLDTSVAKIRTGPQGSIVITTKEGAIWQIDDAPVPLRVTQPGEKLQIRKGALTAYFLRIGNHASVKGRRIQ